MVRAVTDALRRRPLLRPARTRSPTLAEQQRDRGAALRDPDRPHPVVGPADAHLRRPRARGGAGPRQGPCRCSRRCCTYYPHLQALSASSPFWGGHRHRLREQPGADVPAAADGRAAVPVRDVGGVRGASSTTCSTTGRHRRVQGDPLGHPAVAAPRHPRGPGLRRRLRRCASWRALAALTHCLVVDLDDGSTPARRCPRCRRGTSQENKWRVGALRHRRDRHPRRGEPRAAGHRRRARPRRAARAGRARLGCAAAAARRARRSSPRAAASYQRQRAVAARHDGDLRRRRRLARRRARCRPTAAPALRISCSADDAPRAGGGGGGAGLGASRTPQSRLPPGGVWCTRQVSWARRSAPRSMNFLRSRHEKDGLLLRSG